MSDFPQTIYLQPFDEAAPFEILGADRGDIVWCKDKIHSDAVKYVRADEVDLLTLEIEGLRRCDSCEALVETGHEDTETFQCESCSESAELRARLERVPGYRKRDYIPTLEKRVSELRTQLQSEKSKVLYLEDCITTWQEGADRRDSEIGQLRKEVERLKGYGSLDIDVLIAARDERDELRAQLKEIEQAAEHYQKCPLDNRDLPESWERLFELLRLAGQDEDDV